MAEISVTVPVYNVKPYLDRFFNTLLNQTFKGEYEIICVDDGSTDGSGELLDEYAQKYPNIKVIHQQNMGLSEARNTALKYVSGKYTMFCDADDFIAKNTLEDLYNYAQKHNSDVVIFDFYMGVPGTKNIELHHFPNIYRKYGDKTFNIETSEPFVYRFVPVSTWSKFYLTDLVKDIKFEKDLINQDVAHWAIVWTKAKRVNYYPVPFYFYVSEREGSITSGKGVHIFDMFRVFSLAKDTLDEAGYFDKYKYIHYAHLASNIKSRLYKIDPKLREEFIRTVQNYEINIYYNNFYKQDFFTFEKNDMKLVKFIRENCYEVIEPMLKKQGIWK